MKYPEGNEVVHLSLVMPPGVVEVCRALQYRPPIAESPRVDRRGQTIISVADEMRIGMLLPTFDQTEIGDGLILLAKLYDLPMSPEAKKKVGEIIVYLGENLPQDKLIDFLRPYREGRMKWSNADAFENLLMKGMIQHHRPLEVLERMGAFGEEEKPAGAEDIAALQDKILAVDMSDQSAWAAMAPELSMLQKLMGTYEFIGWILQNRMSGSLGDLQKLAEQPTEPTSDEGKGDTKSFIIAPPDQIVALTEQQGDMGDCARAVVELFRDDAYFDWLSNQGEMPLHVEKLIALIGQYIVGYGPAKHDRKTEKMRDEWVFLMSTVLGSDENYRQWEAENVPGRGIKTRIPRMVFRLAERGRDSGMELGQAARSYVFLVLAQSCRDEASAKAEYVKLMGKEYDGRILDYEMLVSYIGCYFQSDVQNRGQKAVDDHEKWAGLLTLLIGREECMEWMNATLPEGCRPDIPAW